MVNIIIVQISDNIDWYNKLTHKVTVYDKSAEKYNTLDNEKIFAETVLQHIIQNYYQLDEVSVFLSENPFQYMYMLSGSRCEIDCPIKIDCVIDKINDELTDTSPFSSFYQIAYNESDKKIKWNGNDITTDEIVLRFFQKEQYIFTAVPGSQFIVPKHNILTRPLEFWQNLYNGIIMNEIPIELIRQLWYLAYADTTNTTVLGEEHELQRLLEYGGFECKCCAMPVADNHIVCVEMLE